MRSKSIRTLVALLAALALGALATASASAALPELEGPFASKAPGHFTLTIKIIEFEAQGGTMTCETANGEGTVTTPKTKTLAFSAITFKGCQLGSWGKCTSSGAASGELRGEPNTDATLAYLSKSEKSVALVFNPAGAKTSFIPAFKCGGSLSVGPVIGSVAGSIGPINTSTTGFSLAFYGSEGVQSIREYENESGVMVKSGLEWNTGLGNRPVALVTSPAALEFGGVKVKIVA
jgi:hypothetical protein